jgi:flavin-dependent dehydrogenase
MCQNPHLKTIFENSQLVFEKPLTISQISFEKKATIENHILMIGDTAGLIHPLCGNGMAMAIHSAKIASELLIDYFDKTIASRNELEKKYKQEWNANFKNRLAAGSILSKILKNENLTLFIIKLIVIFPILLKTIIKHTHGKSLIFNAYEVPKY